MKLMKNRYFLILLPTVVIIAAVGGYLIYQTNTVAGEYDDLAMCLSEQGVKMYGAFWCPHCENQKKDFGSSFRHVNYVECGVRGNQRAQTDVCRQAGITSYPTWEFADGSRVEGELSLIILSGLSGCQMKIDG